MKEKKGFSIMKENSIKAVLDDDMETLLKSLNMFNDVISEKCNCFFCKDKITLENIDAIIPVNNSIVFSCNKNECHLKLIGIEGTYK